MNGTILIQIIFLITVYLKYHRIESKSLTKLAQIIDNYHRPLIQAAIAPLNNNNNKYYERSMRQANVHVSKSMQQFQGMIDKAKMKCANEMGLNPHISAKILLHKENPTIEEKCLSACILKKMKLMDANNKLNAEILTQMAALVSNDNPMVISIALNAAQKCNNNTIKAKEPCEAAYQINKCISSELKANKLKLF